jgi:hypothetical protein
LRVYGPKPRRARGNRYGQNPCENQTPYEYFGRRYARKDEDHIIKITTLWVVIFNKSIILMASAPTPILASIGVGAWID